MRIRKSQVKRRVTELDRDVATSGGRLHDPQNLGDFLECQNVIKLRHGALVYGYD